MTHTVSYRVYYEDTDAGGIMYHGNFINFCERARTEYINTKGLSNRQLGEEGIGIVVRHLEAEYFAPAKLEDFLAVSTEVVEIKNSSFILRQTIQRGDLTLFDMNVVLVCINAQGRPIRIPEIFKQILE